MTRTARIFFVMPLLAVCGLAPYAAGQTTDERGWSFSQRFQGSSNAAGVVLKTSSTATYSFNRHVEAYAGVPIYFAREASATGGSKFMNGIGNVYSGLLVTAGNSAIDYSSDLVVTAPTGDRTRGFSTGHPTIDWTNTFSHSFTAVTPYASIGAANTISDTSFFVRPFSSKGVVAHFEAGALVHVAPRITVGASGYGVRAKGEQQIITKVVEQPAPQPAASPQQPSPGGLLPGIARNAGLGGSAGRSEKDRVQNVFVTRQETLGPPEIANDHGFSTWISVRPGALTDFHIGYSRSATYHFDSVFFGVGFRVGR